MITQIGIMAGEIWRLLEEKEEIVFSEIVQNTEESKEIILMSLGWLAREGHILLEGEKEYKITLRDKKE